MALSTDAPVLSVERLALGDPEGARRWDAFVMAHPQASFFHRAGWQRIVREVLKHDTYFLYASCGGTICGVLPLAHVHTWLGGNALVSLPLAVYAGVVANSALVARALESQAQAIAQCLGVAYLELRHVNARHSDWPAQDLYVTFRKRIAPDVDANLLAIPRKQRAMVRKALRHGLKGEVDADVERFFPLYADNMRRHGTPALSKQYFQALQREFGPDCEVLTVTDPSGTALSSVLSFYFRDEVLPYYAGDACAAREVAANDFKYWDLMRRACERGIGVFDFGRSKRGTGSYAFKTHWGFEATPLGYEYQLYKRDSIPQNNPTNSSFKPLIAAWKRLPLGVANWLGPFIVRGLV